MAKGALLLAGPTASGKSALALALAERLDGVLINADSMQVYRELRILTARPSAEDEARAPHRLYGIVSAAEPFSVGRWLPLARAAIEEALAAGRTPIVVGGTGLYFMALLQGLAPAAAAPPELREAARRRLAELGLEAFRAELAARDPAAAALRDPQRLLRAWEVVEATGRPLSAWRAAPPQGAYEGAWLGVVLERPRPELYGRIDRRFREMVEAGALDEVRALSGRAANLKASGLPELRRCLAGELSLEAAVDAAQQATRRYAKRQLTWLRNKMRAWEWLDAQESERNVDRIISKMSERGLTGSS
jgi:tRNA dimethylallyltransferase